MPWKNLLAIALAMLAIPGQAWATEDFAAARQAMVEEIRADFYATSRYLGWEHPDPAVLAAMGRVPRHEFVPSLLRPLAYANRPLPIGHGQTISQPYIVAVMTQLLQLDPAARVLEIGTGSGYQAAILGELAAEVYSIEIITPLGREAEARLKGLAAANVQVRIGDGYDGWPEQAPFDAIMVTAASSHIPPPLIRQLRPGGRMVIPVGSRFMVQQLVLVQKELDNTVRSRQLLPVQFVPLTGGGAAARP